MKSIQHNLKTIHRQNCPGNPMNSSNSKNPSNLMNLSNQTNLSNPPEKSAGKAKGICRLWLTYKLIKNQKLRTAAIFCGLLFSCFLLESFGIFGYDFWAQVHQGTDEATTYDQTQLILILLVTILLSLVAACSGILLHNLHSLTFAQRWRSLMRLLWLGACRRDIISMTMLENAILYCASIPLGCALALMAANIIGIQSRPPFWLMGGILLWIWTVSCLCSIRPLGAALHRPSHKPGTRPKKSMKKRKTPPSSVNFKRFMTRTYRCANRRHHARIILTILAAILLYVPAGYLIETNINIQRAQLDARHGIQYSCSPQNWTELTNALNECRQLAFEDSSIVYVSVPASASVKTDLLSEDLRRILKSADWNEDAAFSTDSAIYFLADQAYAKYLDACGLSANTASPAVLIDRYINRSRWSEDAVQSYQEVPLLNTQKDCSGVEIHYMAADETQRNLPPDAVTRQIPEGVDFDGSLSVILPLRRLKDFLPPSHHFLNVYVCGKFPDPDETTFSKLETILGENSQGSLRYTRKILQEWYSSMNGIHKAMTAICSLLFFIAALNIFSMLLFQYMERKKGLAVLWSLGLSPKELLTILTAEHIWNLLSAIILGIPLSGLSCYYIYTIFRQVWHVDYAFPLRQTALIVTAACFLSALAVLAESLLIRRQDFLKDIKDIT